MERNCLNCAISTLVEDQLTKRKRRRCMPNGMWVNRRMCCEEWRAAVAQQHTQREPFVGAVSVSGITTEKKR